ncbi:hypothetical protein BDV26DRAFT_262929 [Aspergillus bertholletiae]|uniref:Uncharacterized protein n=1 Tax=Aspergillus bertholletiae TaxID=1226010 RepID=A0A5N7B7Q7_9EURO|nr:hypothetical protein BDV26DRAFT_262929 [Aspergillus bertholletiae]
MQLFFASISPYLTCLGWQRKTNHTSSQDPLMTILQDGKSQINGRPAFRRHYIKQQVGDRYQIVRQVNTCDIGEGGQTVTHSWTEEFTIEGRRLQKSKCGLKLLQDYEICKRPT